MNTRIFGRTGRTVGEVGLGTWQLGAGWGDVSEETALATLRAAYESGTTLFDPADVYGMGRAETLIGRFLRKTTIGISTATASSSTWARPLPACPSKKAWPSPTR